MPAARISADEIVDPRRCLAASLDSRIGIRAHQPHSQNAARLFRRHDARRSHTPHRHDCRRRQREDRFVACNKQHAIARPRQELHARDRLTDVRLENDWHPVSRSLRIRVLVCWLRLRLMLRLVSDRNYGPGRNADHNGCNRSQQQSGFRYTHDSPRLNFYFRCCWLASLLSTVSFFAAPSRELN